MGYAFSKPRSTRNCVLYTSFIQYGEAFRSTALPAFITNPKFPNAGYLTDVYSSVWGTSISQSLLSLT
jgi:hypothetical protein